MTCVEEVNDDKRIIPTIVFPDGSILVEPSNAELANELGLQTKAKRQFYDLIVVGSGLAGLHGTGLDLSEELLQQGMRKAR
ncbi:MAG: hypothetical protein GWN61_17485 [candidate division Zixibacteria bacterium]|nr:hypothetical protein [candidate division Zixibacteria bacterium]NIS47663.1 hypothetical protein [candidate division Zixibacteria bacterium]NIU15767.1 hypothetical protein [candidate division Zixibacteria bacterium]NIV07914.1 hypothetical protein [candidate division Zixibacteria bacterium]NIW47203.1 hypothetical protein [Gammaproteobacteria bacterium]